MCDMFEAVQTVSIIGSSLSISPWTVSDLLSSIYFFFLSRYFADPFSCFNVQKGDGMVKSILWILMKQKTATRVKNQEAADGD